MEVATELLTASVLDLAVREPIAALTLATSHQLVECAREVASLIAEDFGLAFTHIPDLEWFSAQAYDQLLRYVAAREDTAREVLAVEIPFCRSCLPANSAVTNAADSLERAPQPVETYHTDSKSAALPRDASHPCNHGGNGVVKSEAPWLRSFVWARDRAIDLPDDCFASWYTVATEVASSKNLCDDCQPILKDMIALRFGLFEAMQEANKVELQV
ncbi:hypothetical protein BC628DRAFT_1469990 [Trametes gibbosa]|nr:hypothetical protein BC628DRAFT_1469990 [Trametes gibbosa]